MLQSRNDHAQLLRDALTGASPVYRPMGPFGGSAQMPSIDEERARLVDEWEEGEDDEGERES